MKGRKPKSASVLHMARDASWLFLTEQRAEVEQIATLWRERRQLQSHILDVSQGVALLVLGIHRKKYTQLDSELRKIGLTPIDLVPMEDTNHEN